MFLALYRRIPSPSISAISVQLPTSSLPSSSNVHPMITRGKLGIFKPKSYIVALAEFNVKEPSTVNQALQDPSWKASIEA